MRGTWQTTDSGGGGLVLAAVIIAALALGSGAVTAAVNALVTVLIITACVITLAALGVIAWLVHRARSGRLQQPAAGPPAVQAPATGLAHLEGPRQAAIGPGREVHLHFNVTPDQLAAIMRQHTGEE